jgi:two-component system, NarL family, invasion response regulator UvrY
MTDQGEFYYLLVDDHPLMQNAASHVFSCEQPNAKIDEACSLAQALEFAGRSQYDLILLDLCLPDTRLEYLEKLKQLHPNVPVLVVNGHDEVVLTDGVYISEALTRQQATPGVRGHQHVHSCLSQRELEVLCLIAKGKSVSTIANWLSRSVKTISTHRANILQKMNMQTNCELMHYCFKTGLVR